VAAVVPFGNAEAALKRAAAPLVLAVMFAGKSALVSPL
jgi:hypothetical protein